MRFAVAEEILKYKLDLVGVQDIRWDRGGIAPAGDCTFFYGKGIENHELGTCFFVHKRIVSAVKRVEFVSDRISYIILKGRWCDIIVMNVFRAADCDTDHYLVLAKVRETLAVSKQTTHRVHTERFNLKKLNEEESKEQYCVEISNRFVALENLDTEVDVNEGWKTIRI
ncbi:hypothetical protein B7P43_G01277 [Cryptotermes secundus]|uniref:Endonuclease/exonuclease/phosphatase domain-containing protein n=1 Tax=Cryptotermes secundus TaxID=105785 RepID=A0A2J7RP76_9NEOP|nr:hypothetical protein B7P43_G01277 [Cryptotermes secundus]